MKSCLFVGDVRHHRRRPQVHKFRYRLFMFYLDLDELPDFERSVWPFSLNRLNLVAFHDRDYLDGSATDTKTKMVSFLRRKGVELSRPRIYLLTQCRLLGYAFNPISVYYCHEGGVLRAVVAEVNNTFGERYLYLLRDQINTGADQINQTIHYRATKALHVSPFLSMAGQYDFYLAPVGDRFGLNVVHSENGECTLTASFQGARVELTARSLFRVLGSFPFAAVKTIAGIHVEALRLWMKGLPVYRQPPPSRAQELQGRDLDKFSDD